MVSQKHIQVFRIFYERSLAHLAIQGHLPITASFSQSGIAKLAFSNAIIPFYQIVTNNILVSMKNGIVVYRAGLLLIINSWQWLQPTAASGNGWVV